MLKTKNCARNSLVVAVLLGLALTSPALHAQEKKTISGSISAKTKEYLSDPARTGSLVGSIIAGAAIANPLAPLIGSVAGFMIGKSSAFTQNNSYDTRRQAYLNRSLTPGGNTEITDITGLAGPASQLSASEEFSFTVAPSEPSISDLAVVATTPATLPQSAIAPTLGAATQALAPFNQNASLPSPMQPSEISEIVDQTSQTAHTLVPVTPSNPFSEISPPMQASEISRIAPSTHFNSASKADLQKQLARACYNSRIEKTLAFSCYYYSQ